MQRRRMSFAPNADVRRAMRALMKHHGWSQREVIRAALERGLGQMRLDAGVREFQEHRASLSRGAEIAGVTVFEFMEELNRRRISLWEILAEDIADDSAAVANWHP